MAEQQSGCPQAGEEMHKKRGLNRTCLLLLFSNHTSCVCLCQASGSAITAICSMRESQFAVGYMKCRVDVWRLLWNQQHSNAR